MNYTKSVVVRLTPHQVTCLSKIAVFMKTDISTVIRLCVNDGIETFMRWSGSNVLEPQFNHNSLDKNVV